MDGIRKSEVQDDASIKVYQRNGIKTPLVFAIPPKCHFPIFSLSHLLTSHFLQILRFYFDFRIF